MSNFRYIYYFMHILYIYYIKDYICVCICVCVCVCVSIYLEKEMTTHCSVLAWKTPWTEKPVQSE